MNNLAALWLLTLFPARGPNSVWSRLVRVRACLAKTTNQPKGAFEPFQNRIHGDPASGRDLLCRLCSEMSSLYFVHRWVIGVVGCVCVSQSSQPGHLLWGRNLSSLESTIGHTCRTASGVGVRLISFCCDGGWAKLKKYLPLRSWNCKHWDKPLCKGIDDQKKDSFDNWLVVN